jgi:hypothetical protein
MTLMFLGLLIYALAVSNTDTVTEVCGNALVNLMIARLCLTLLEMTLVYCFGSNDGAKSIAGCFVIIFHIVFLGMGAFYVSEAMNSMTCNAAMAAVSITESPLLGILGYVYVGIDALFALVILCVCVGLLAFEPTGTTEQGGT